MILASLFTRAGVYSCCLQYRRSRPQRPLLTYNSLMSSSEAPPAQTVPELSTPQVITRAEEGRRICGLSILARAFISIMEMVLASIGETICHGLLDDSSLVKDGAELNGL